MDGSAAWSTLLPHYGVPDARANQPGAHPNCTDRSQRDRGSRIDRCADDTDADDWHTGADTGTDTDADFLSHTGADA